MYSLLPIVITETQVEPLNSQLHSYLPIAGVLRHVYDFLLAEAKSVLQALEDLRALRILLEVVSA